MTCDEFLERLDEVRQTGTISYQARCPAHDDRNPSLGILDLGDKVWINCFAGCKKEDILDELGMTWRDLFYDEEGEKELGIPSATYDYVTEEGNLLYQKLRFEPKRFAYLQNDGTWGRGEKKVLYRLPELLSAIRRGEEVWIVEGEKDVESLRRIGVTATTAGGVNDWQPQFPQYFLGAKVVICFDSDGSGREAAKGVRESIRLLAERIREVEARGNDISEHLMAGYKLKEVKEVWRTPTELKSHHSSPKMEAPPQNQLTTDQY